MKAVFLDYATMGSGVDTSPLTALFPDVRFYETTGAEQVAERIRDAEFIFTNKVHICGELIKQSANLRFIGLVATGTDNIDLETARTHGVAVTNTRAYATRSVTEHVFGLLLMLARNLHRYSANVKDGAWQTAAVFSMQEFPIRELSSMTMGIVGYGELGQAVASKAHDFGMNVVVSARPGSDEIPADRILFDELLQISDVISLHCPLTDATHELFGAEQFARMKPSAILINTARGALLDSAALTEALSTEQITAAAIDVLPIEPPAEGNPLLDYRGDNLIVTPHIAWASDRARQECLDQLAENIGAFLKGEELRRVV